MISFETVFSLLIFLLLIQSLVITQNANQIDTTLYEYQLVNDIAETIEKTNCYDNYLTGGMIARNNHLNDISQGIGYCIKVEDKSFGIITNEYNTCNQEPINNVISTERHVPLTVNVINVKYIIWQER